MYTFILNLNLFSKEKEEEGKDYNKFFFLLFFYIEKIWELRENVNIPRETEEPPVSPIDIETNIKKWNESHRLNKSPRSPDVHQRNRFNAKPNDKENSATKTDRRKSNFKSIVSLSFSLSNIHFIKREQIKKAFIFPF